MHTTASEPKRDEEDKAGPADEADDEAPEEAAGRDSLYEHIKKVDQRYDALTKDAATEDQAKEQKATLLDEDDKPDDEQQQEEDGDVVMKEETQDEQQQDVEEMEPERIGQNKKKGQKRGDQNVMEEGDPEGSALEELSYWDD